MVPFNKNAQWLSFRTAALQKDGPGCESQSGLFLHVLLIHIWVLSGYSCFIAAMKGHERYQTILNE